MTENFGADVLHVLLLTSKHLNDLTVVVIITKISVNKFEEPSLSLL